MLVKAKKEVDKILKPIKSSCPSFSVNIISYGYTNATHHPLINFMVSSFNGPVFLKTMDALGKYKDAQYVGELFIKVIADVGVDSCVKIITYNVPILNTNGMSVENKYPQLFWTPYIVHSLNLSLKYIVLDVTWMGIIIYDSHHIHIFVQIHTNSLTIYKNYTHLSLLKSVDTQFASSFIMLKRLREVNTTHEAMVILVFWYF
jgi:hypothetical protein